MSPLLKSFQAALTEVERVERERDDARCEVARLGRHNDELCDRIAELEARIAELTNGRAA